MSDFDTDTAVRPAEGGYDGAVTPRWNIGDNPNGGYLLAIGVRAMLAESGRPDPVTVTAHYLSPPVAGPIAVRTQTVKAGRSFATVTAQMVQDGRERVRLVGAFGDLAAQRGPTRISASPPDVPPPDQCVSLADLTRGAGRDVPEAMHRYDLVLPPDSPWGRPKSQQGDPFEITGWIRFKDGTQPTTLSLVTFADAFPPTMLGSVETGWLPTIELTVHVRAAPASGWMLGTFKTRFLMDGLLEEDGELWDSTGRPVALSRQLGLVLQPR
ncbi:MAG: thioesterase family protein [Acidimicrobiaceae bacterium]|nr:thioesterase family protein [Acidimicrobiaceae bacterium]